MLSTLAQSARRLFAPPSSHIPGPRARYPGQHIVWLATDKLALFREMAAHGDITRIRIGPQPVVLVMHPDDIRKVLVTQQRNFHKGRATERTKLLMGQGLLTSEGEFHLRQRRLMQPAFHRERLATYANVMLEAAQHTGANWRDGTNVDVHDAMMKLTLGVAGRTLFDADVDGNAHDVAEAMELSLRMFSYAILPLGALLEHAPIPWVRDLHRSRKRMDTFIYRMIDERRANGYHDRGDLMSMLLAARDAEGDGGGMDDVQLRNEVVTLLLAGHETTANWLTWTWYVLSRTPDVESRLHSELDRVLDGRAPMLSDVPRLEYLRRVLSESLRMYPPAWSLERRAIDDVQVGDHVIRKGTIVLTCQWLVHRDPRWWNEPERFDPDRWTPEAEALRPKFSYFPFGAGTRICIAEHFAWMEAMLVMATLAQHWRARYESSNAVIPEPLVTLRPKGGLRVRLERRSPATAA
jgi:cytochrome P450